MPREKDGRHDKAAQELAEAQARRGGVDPHSALSNPAGSADPTEWPDPYDPRPDPRGPDRPDERSDPGATSTSQPHPRQDPLATLPDVGKGEHSSS
jgi:hypothetical protein